METQKPLLKDEDGEEVDVYMYRSIIGSLMYLTSSRPDIMFAVCSCARLHVTQKCKKQTVVANSTTKAEYVAALSCCGQVKTINGEAQLHALVDGKKIIITESSVRRDLQLADEEGVDCLPNSTIFEQLTLMGYEKISQKLTFYKPFFSPQWKFLIHTILKCLSLKTTAWNEFSSTMASAIICLATNQKFNFSKFIFESMIRNLDNLSGKFLMYPRRVGKDFSGRVTPLFQTMVVQNQSQLGEGSAILTDPHHTPTFIQPSTQPQKTQQPRKPKRKDTQVPQPSDPIENVADEAGHKELGDSLVRAATTASSLEAEQVSRNINKTQSKATPNESSSLGTTSGGGPRCQETMGDTIAQTRFESVSKHSNDSLLARGFLILRDKGPLKIYEIVVLKRIESSDYEESLGEDASKQRELLPLVRRCLLQNKKFAAGNVVSTAGDATTVSAATTNTATITIVDDITLAQALIEIKSIKPKEKGDKGKGILIEHVKPMKNKDLIRIDEESALKLQAEFDEKERLAREKTKKEKEVNIALIETCDKIQAKIDVDHQLDERLQAQEQEELSIEEKATLFQQFLEKRRKHFAAKRAEEKRNKPP
ncbi:hypothetical protein Tco_0302821, partial [Tanacetum coccineum]